MAEDSGASKDPAQGAGIIKGINDIEASRKKYTVSLIVGIVLLILLVIMAREKETA